jgi:hypothetical protein
MQSLSGKFKEAVFSVASCLVILAFVVDPGPRGRLSSAQAGSSSLPTAASPRTYRVGTKLYLDNGIVKVGVETAWGGAITEFDWHGLNFVNNFDTGRCIQVAVYDGNPYPACGDCTGAFGWDPVQGGDHFKNGSPVIDKQLGGNFLYTKTRPYQWVPENKGGSKTNPILGDVFIEQWIYDLPAYPEAVRIHYKITHFGKDFHTNAFQEIPAIYTNWQFGRFVYYDGDAPWTNASLSSLTMPNLPKRSTVLYTPERWATLANDKGIGLTAYVPWAYPYSSGFRRQPDNTKNSGTNYFFFRVPFSFGPGTILEGDVYLFAGDYLVARKAVYALNQSNPHHDILPPYGVVDHPKPHEKLTGTTTISGWAIDDTHVSKIEVLLDNEVLGTATYGLNRSDVSKTWPHSLPNVGFSYELDTTKISNGPHVLGLNAVDQGGNVSLLARVPVFLTNSAHTQNRR